MREGFFLSQGRVEANGNIIDALLQVERGAKRRGQMGAGSCFPFLDH